MYLMLKLPDVADRRLKGIVTTEPGREQQFSGTLGLLRILGDLEPPDAPSAGNALSSRWLR